MSNPITRYTETQFGLVINDEHGEWVRYADHLAVVENMEEQFSYDLIEQQELDDMARGE